MAFKTSSYEVPLFVFVKYEISSSLENEVNIFSLSIVECLINWSEEDPEFRLPTGGSKIKNNFLSENEGYLPKMLVNTASTSVLTHSPMNPSQFDSNPANSLSSISFTWIPLLTTKLTFFKSCSSYNSLQAESKMFVPGLSLTIRILMLSDDETSPAPSEELPPLS